MCEELIQLNLLQNHVRMSVSKHYCHVRYIMPWQETPLDLFDVLLHNQRDVRSRLEVSVECSLESSFRQEIQWFSLEQSIFMWNSHQNSNTPTLPRIRYIRENNFDAEGNVGKKEIRGIITSRTASNAEIPASTLPEHSMLLSTPPFVISRSTCLVLHEQN